VAQPLTPWVALEDVLRVYAPELIDPVTGDITTDPELQDQIVMWQTAIDSATWMMWALSGGKVHASEAWMEEYSLIGSCEVMLWNGPLQMVISAEEIESCPHAKLGVKLEFCWDFQRVNFCCSGAERPWYRRCGCKEHWVRILYRTESTLPPGTEGRVAWFADQYVKAQTGDKACQLPDRIQSVSRQGVSWTMLDPMDFLDKKLTGVGRLDTWLTTVRLVYPASQLIDPLRMQRRNSRRLPRFGANEVTISRNDPIFNVPTTELWVKDAAAPEAAPPADEMSEEIIISTDDPIAANPTAELWFNPDAVSVP
jgi:hypothetical protein